ncbi:MAG: hypothetical protein A2Y62_00400 [Candidatus Fischerbacteria bacterium RBG_13_37_8]|uniref:GmrSD restriction endonucleases N-terminal domain-containing protein n=1 Tax=Candidatus Fischerbacteria bacterium RBG_13_37_8 TaxID=1817863 RepID=A0A1F5V9D8_9BACT|nr:MAG: hypothetical protein A2Y62_00400 [Candidatus Fischerbacteria bacterium RBG_13_37_8]
MQLPDFQRGWVWDDDHIRSLIASVSMSYPIGAVMLLQTGGDGAQFQPRLVEGVVLSNDTKPEYLILDGQQRMTSLYLSLFNDKPVQTTTEKKQKIERFYYLDIVKCLDEKEDRIDAVISIPAEKKITSDFGRKIELNINTQEKEFEQCLFPLNIVYENIKYQQWRRGFNNYYRTKDESKLDIFDRFEAEIVLRFQSIYRVPVIELIKDTPKEAVCQVFEKVNTGGVTLTVFELITAIFAADNFNLRKDWEIREERITSNEVISGFDATAFLTSVTLLASYNSFQASREGAISCKRREVLKLILEDYKKYADKIEEGLKLAARFLAREKVFDSRSLPYSTQIIPLSVICAILGNQFEQDSVRKKLAQWYWCGVFGELYGGANEPRFAFDVPEVIMWLEGADLPRTIRDSSFVPNRLLSMQSRLSAAYKGLMALLMKAGSLDFLSGDSIEISSYFDMAIDIHHIFPKTYCEEKQYKKDLWNSSVNKAPLSAKSNRIISGKAPSVYLTTIEKQHYISNTRLDEILFTHQIKPELLRNDAFEKFINDRALRLLDLIEGATGKSIAGRDSDETISAFGGKLI